MHHAVCVFIKYALMLKEGEWCALAKLLCIVFCLWRMFTNIILGSILCINNQWTAYACYKMLHFYSESHMHLDDQSIYQTVIIIFQLILFILTFLSSMQSIMTWSQSTYWRRRLVCGHWPPLLNIFITENYRQGTEPNRLHEKLHAV